MADDQLLQDQLDQANERMKELEDVLFWIRDLGDNPDEWGQGDVEALNTRLNKALESTDG